MWVNICPGLDIRLCNSCWSKEDGEVIVLGKSCLAVNCVCVCLTVAARFDLQGDTGSYGKWL